MPPSQPLISIRKQNSATQLSSNSTIRHSLFAIRHSLLPLGLLLAGMGGGFAPWLWRESVALQLTAPGLAEFIKFLPEVRLGQVHVQRLYFLLPLFLAMLALPMFVENRRLGLAAWQRWPLRLAVVPLAMAGLSPVWTPAILTAPEFRLQTLLAGLAVLLSLAAPLFRRLPLRLLAGLFIPAGLAAPILAAWQFHLVRPGLIEAYHQPVSLGWGWWLTLLGLGLSLLCALSLVLTAPPAAGTD